MSHVSDSGRTGIGVYAKAEEGLVFRCRFRNPDNCSVFRLELLAIRESLDFALRFETSDAYILTKAEFAFNGFPPMLESSAMRLQTCLRKRKVLFLLLPLVNSSEIFSIHTAKANST
ncbi:hypothetical protein AVEN_154543-1 [Araneus ventricosus]|uniref:RNase H type-1 domain-containing protein n=1 Tax=Araneus ventricosus TaxID=182803 RepID=A0A4Y2IUD3_ARAVE|nr:hypothetical protein AVEN_154543-1 [Araneus ventricosus]